MKHVAIAGGGASGALLANALIAAGAKVTLFEPRDALGLGVAYATTNPVHLLNAPSRRMSAIAGVPDHFVDWLATNGHDPLPDAFVPRNVYGAYLASIVDAMKQRAGDRFVHVRSAMVRAVEHDLGVRITSVDRRVIEADMVVIAIGNAKPSSWPRISDAARATARVFDSVWHTGAMEPADADETVVILGTGLTAVDAVLGLRSNGHIGPIKMISRRGLLPQEHRLFDRPPPSAPNAETIADVIAALRDTSVLEGADWRQALDQLRSEVNARWEALDHDEQRRFFRHVLPYWNVHRHRMAPAAATAITDLRAAGTLEMIAGRTGTIGASPRGLRVPVELRGTGDVRVIDAGRVINCSGPEHDIMKRKNPLIASLLASGAIAAHPLRVGMKIAPDGALIDARGTTSTRVFAIGPVRYGTLIETTAIPEIREQVLRLTERIAGTAEPRASLG